MRTVTATSTSTKDPMLGFSTLEQETVVDELPLQGELPHWLGGSLLRTGPAKFEIGEQRMKHWFDGQAMLHRFTIDDGRVSYGNRFLESRSYRAAREQGRMVYGEFATDPCRSLFKRVQTLFSQRKLNEALPDNANINVMKLGERFIAMTETPLPVQFDAHTLKAADVRPYRTPGQLTTAHPHVDRASGSMLNYAANLGPRSSYRFFMVGPRDTEPSVIASLPVKHPSYMHSFGLSRRAVFVASPEAEHEDEGVLLSVVLDAATGTSFLLVLDAGDLAELARAQAPHHIPFSFHGQFASA